MPVTSDDLQWFDAHFRRISDNVATVIQGKPDTIELVTVCMLSDGHALIEDVPGVGKTLLAKSLARPSTAPFSESNSHLTCFRPT